jgi:hypothetical protein
MPGPVKFAGELALDPLTYVSSGLLSGISKAKYVAPILQRIPGGVPAAEAAISGMKSYEGAVDEAFKSGSDLVRGIANNYVPLTVAKNNARSILTKTLPEGLVNNLLDSIPNEYTGVPVGAITGPINKAVPNLGLPTILKFPDTKILKQQIAYNTVWQATHNAFSDRGINIFQPDETLDYGKTLRDIVRNPQDEKDFIAASIIRRPTLLTKTDLGRLNSSVGGILNRDVATDSHVLHLNEVLNTYHLGEIDEGTAVQALSQMFGVSAKANPDATEPLHRLLSNRDTATTEFINDLTKRTPQEITNILAGRAKDRAGKEFDLRVTQERAAGTYMDKFLTGFDNVYTTVYKNFALRYIVSPVSMLYLGFLGYPVGNAVESYARHIVGGGGFDFPIHSANFNIENGLLDAPPELFKESSRQAFVAKEIVARASGTPLDYPTSWVRDLLVEPGSKVEQAIRRHYWNSALSQELDNVYFAKGLSARTDFQDWFQAATPPDVGSDPKFAGLSQTIADSVSRMGVKAVAQGESAVNGIKNAIDTGLFNREKLAADLLDNEDFADLHPTSRMIMRDWARTGEASSAGASSMVDRVIDNEKKLVEVAPNVLAEKFRGLSNKIITRAKTPTFGSADLYQNVNDLRALFEQYASIPEMLRMREYDVLQANQLKGIDTAAIHDKFAKDLKDSMEAVDKAIQPAYTQLVGQADRLGLRPEVENYVNALRAQQDALALSWSKDAEFREGFFKQKPNRRLQSTWDDPQTGYFPQRKAIWDGFAEKQAVLSHQATEARLGLETAIKGQKEREAAFNARLTEIRMASEDAAHVESSISEGRTAEEIATDIPGEVRSGGYTTQVSELDARNASDDEYRRILSTGSRQLNDAGTKYANWKEKAHAYAESERRQYGGITPESIQREQSASETSGGIGVTENVRPAENGANDITGNGPSADSAGTIPTADFIAREYANKDALRPRINNRIQQAISNPAITDAHKQELINYVDNLNKVFNSLDQSKRKVLNDSLKEAVSRTRERYFQAYINYDDQTIFDFLAKHIFPFWVYESRRWPYLANTALKFPGLAAAYNNYMDKTDQGYVNIGEIPYDVNPLRGTVLGGIKRAVGADQPLRQTDGLAGALESIEATFGKFGFYLGPHISIPSQFIRGEGGQSLPELFSSAINMGRAADIPGAAGIQNLLPDPFRDYYVRQILASQNLEPDKVYERAADDPNSMEAKALDLAQRQAGIVGTVLGQTGVLRYRTSEYSDYLSKRAEAIEKITGISVQKQAELRQQGISISQVSTLTPAQRQELAALPGTTAFQEVAEPLLNPVAQRLRKSQRDFFDAIKAERERVTADQEADDRRFEGGIISGVEWRKRYQDRSGRVSDMVNDLKKTEAYKNVPISSDEQVAARQRFNLPPLTQSPCRYRTERILQYQTTNRRCD